MPRKKRDRPFSETGLIRFRIRAAADRRAIKKGRKSVDGLDQIIDAAMDAAIGIRVERPDANAPGGIRVYEQPPDIAAARVLMEQMFGRAKESLEVTAPAAQAPGSVPFLLVPMLPKGKE